MSSNLANVYAYLKKSSTDFDVILIEPVSYLKTITGNNNKIIFICKKISQTKQYQELTPQKLNLINIREHNSLNLTGSPLKDDCEIDTFNLSIDLQLDDLTLWNKDEEMYKAITLDKARSIICNMNFQREGQNSSGAVWLLCDAKDQDKTILLNINFENGYNSRGCIKFNGLLPSNQLKSTDLIKTHCSLIKGTNKIDTAIENFFNIKPNITLKLSWNTAAVNPTFINTKNCDCTIFQTIKLNGTDSVAEDFYRQLIILNVIREDILAYKTNEPKNCEAVYRCGSGIDIDTLSERITNIMTDFSRYGDSVNSSDTIAIEAVILKAKNRYSTDITDKLWEILKCCSSYNDLKIAFNYVFQCAAMRNIVNIPSNKNCLAEIIREVSQHRLAIPCLTGTEPLELLLEIGLEKLHKDYEYIFTESKICSSNDLQILQNNNFGEMPVETKLNVRNTLHNAMKPDNTKSNLQERKTLLHSNNSAKLNHFCEVVGFQNSKFNKNDVEYKLSKLLQIHLILEHLLSIQINLNLENVYNQIFSQLIQKPVIQFDQNINSYFDKIVISIMIDKVLHHVVNKDPHARRIVMSSQNKFRKVESTFYFSMDNIFPPNIFPGINTDDKEMSRENIYFHWNYTKIQTRRN